ncbi:carbohydrate kinase family protein [Caloramator proteoclasticus]|uniref:Pseudouridine kinase n=1 Tax=Caloramator proteoclasticus DSM 10124 TaxID=1121262 RepID=A0A1M5BXU5_9CLOT|nr:carbohydrate kinase family protein [Caloramator proteoclasticus]SHF47383.1 pseudouridine kinase [Caloramator proteoclasticus DSM 10124]
MEKTFDVAVFGAVFVDIKGFPRDVLNPKGTNIGSVKFKHGGVARNVVENFSYMGLKTRFVSIVDNSALGMEVLARLKNEKIDTEYVDIVDKDGMGMWLVVLNEKGDIAASVSHQPNLKYLYNIIDNHAEDIIRGCNSVVLDLDFEASYIEKIINLAKRYNKRVYAVIGHLDVVKRNKHLFNKLDCLICNNIEFELIAEKTFDTKEQVLDACKELTKNGLKKIVVTMGKKGSVFYDAETNEEGFVDIVPVNVIDTTGAGDSFFAGTVYGLISGYSLEKAVCIGTRIASLTISCKDSTNPEIKQKMHIIVV